MPSMTTDLALMPATMLLELFRSRRASPVEATQAALARIERLNPIYNGYCLVDADGALAAARAAEARWFRGAPVGLVDGVPASVKDLVIAKGWPTRRGTRVSSQAPEPEDAPAVARLREQGAVLLGKTTAPEFGWAGISDSPLTGATGNPWNPAMTAGGSSSGAAVAAALGQGALHIGTDAGGSIRIPAAFCGIFGLKPTTGRVPAYPPSTLAPLANTGPMTRSVADAALMLTVLSAPDVRDWRAPPLPAQDFRTSLNAGVAGLRIAYSPTLGYVDTVDPQIRSAVDAAARTFEALGAVVERVDPGFADPRHVVETIWWGRLGVSLGDVARRRGAEMDPHFVAGLALGDSFTVADHLAADDAIDAITRHMALFHRRFDLLLTPQMPIAAFPLGQVVPEGRGMTAWFDWSPFTTPFNLSQQPAASIPCGRTADGLPIGLQIVGARFREDLVLRAAEAFERVHPIALPKAAA